jgi:pimeloyl-ACP methyl ester carboxylesterase
MTSGQRSGSLQLTARPATPWAARRAGDDYGTPATPDWREVDWAPHVHQIAVGGRKVNYVDYGPRDSDLRPVVLVHGLAACWQCWLEQIPRLAAEGRRVIALDLPGFGDSEMPSEDISVEGYGRSVESLCDSLDLGQVVVVGHSMGGFTAAEFAIQYPKRVERLVLQAAAGISTNDVRRDPTMAGARVIAGVATRTAARSRFVATRPRMRWLVFQTVMRHPSRIPADLVYELISHTGRPGFLPALDAILGYDYRDRLAQISCPTLVVWGSDDMLVPRRDADEYARVIPGARKVVFDDTGHSPMMERPQTFNDCLMEFLGEERAERPDESALEDAKRAAGEEPLGAGSSEAA